MSRPILCERDCLHVSVSLCVLERGRERERGFERLRERMGAVESVWVWVRARACMWVGVSECSCQCERGKGEQKLILERESVLVVHVNIMYNTHIFNKN